MRLALMFLLLSGLWRAGPARAEDFDYFILSLSWSAGWCAAEGDARGADQCDPRHAHGFLLHGLWPQHETGGWPEFCRSPHAPPARAETRAMADIMGSDGLAWHQWRKHGSCSGLSPRGYFDAARRAFAAVVQPGVLARLDRPLRIAPEVLEAAVAEANPRLSSAMMVVSCPGGRITELRICLSRDLAPRDCPPGLRTCTLPGALLDPPR